MKCSTPLISGVGNVLTSPACMQALARCARVCIGGPDSFPMNIKAAITTPAVLAFAALGNSKPSAHLLADSNNC